MVTRGGGTLGGVKKESGASLVNCDKIVLGSISGKESRFYSGLLEHKSQEATIMASPTLSSSDESWQELLHSRGRRCNTFGENRNSNACPEEQEGNSRSGNPLHNLSHAQVSADDNNPEAHIRASSNLLEVPNSAPTVETLQAKVATVAWTTTTVQTGQGVFF
jgi:hypothetical protein